MLAVRLGGLTCEDVLEGELDIACVQRRSFNEGQVVFT
jgi:hypothetical protein